MSPLSAAYGVLAIAIVLEVAATSLLQRSRQFTEIGPTLLMIALYVAAFYLISVSLRTIPVGIVYALWSGFGIVLISVVGALAFGQKLDAPAVGGIGLIVAGVMVINLFSATLPG